MKPHLLIHPDKLDAVNTTHDFEHITTSVAAFISFLKHVLISFTCLLMFVSVLEFPAGAHVELSCLVADSYSDG